MQTRSPLSASGGWQVDRERGELRAHGALVPIGSRAFEILVVLIEGAGALVSKDELMSRIWPGAIVEENTLHAHISAVRRALGPDRGMLKTVSGRGYRLVGTWAVRAPRPDPPRRRSHRRYPVRDQSAGGSGAADRPRGCRPAARRPAVGVSHGHVD